MFFFGSDSSADDASPTGAANFGSPFSETIKSKPNVFIYFKFRVARKTVQLFRHATH